MLQCRNLAGRRLCSTPERLCSCAAISKAFGSCDTILPRECRNFATETERFQPHKATYALLFVKTAFLNGSCNYQATYQPAKERHAQAWLPPQPACQIRPHQDRTVNNQELIKTDHCPAGGAGMGGKSPSGSGADSTGAAAGSDGVLSAGFASCLSSGRSDAGFSP